MLQQHHQHHHQHQHQQHHQHQHQHHQQDNQNDQQQQQQQQQQDNQNDQNDQNKGKVLENYSLVSALGQGLFGDVYKAKCLKTSALVALKIVPRKKIKEEKMRKEKDKLQSLKHPNIVNFIDYYEDNKRYYLVEELVDGGDLIDVLKIKSKYTETEGRMLVLSLLEAVKYMHSKDIVHRDIKCDNILCHIDLQGPISLKLTDFGHATECVGIDLTEHSIGTHGYRSPEIILKQNYGKPCDLFSVGVVSYMILLGTFPFHPKLDDFEQKVLHCEHTCSSLKEKQATLWGAISKKARSFLLKLLEYHHIKRLSADEALRDDWINENESMLSVNDLSEALGELRRFNARRKLIACIRKVMLFNVNVFRKRKNKEMNKEMNKEKADEELNEIVQNSNDNTNNDNTNTNNDNNSNDNETPRKKSKIEEK